MHGANRFTPQEDTRAKRKKEKKAIHSLPEKDKEKLETTLRNAVPSFQKTHNTLPYTDEKLHGSCAFSFCVLEQRMHGRWKIIQRQLRFSFLSPSAETSSSP